MSNLIKAYTIHYNEDSKKIIDTNAAAEAKVQHYLDILNIRNEIEKKEQDGFVEGLTAASVEEIPEEEQQQEELKETELETAVNQLSSTQEMMNQAQERADDMIAQAKLESEQIRKEAQEEITKQLEQARKEGYEQGCQEGQEEAKRILQEERHQLKLKEETLIKEYDTKLKEFEPVFADLLIAYLKRFTGVILDDKRDIILYLIEQELFNVDSSNTYLIHVSKDDYDMVSAKKNELAWKVKDNADIEIIQDQSLLRAQCLIETDSRIIDCSLDVQLKNLINDLKLLAGPREEYFSQIGASNGRD